MEMQEAPKNHHFERIFGSVDGRPGVVGFSATLNYNRKSVTLVANDRETLQTAWGELSPIPLDFSKVQRVALFGAQHVKPLEISPDPFAQTSRIPRQRD